MGNVDAGAASSGPGTFRESCVALGTAEIEIADDLFVEQFCRRHSRTPKSNNIKKQVSFCRKHPRAECPL